MTKRTVVPLLILAMAALVAPGATALPDAGVEVRADALEGPSADTDAVSLPVAQAAAPDLVPARVRLGEDGATLAAGPAAHASSAEGGPGHVDANVARAADGPGRSDPATVATTATGIAVLAALVAYYWGSIQLALAGALVPLFSRIRGSEVLDNGVRQRIHDAIEHNPGITIKEVATLCQAGWGTTVYHLKRLEDERLVVSERTRQFRRYYKNGGGISNRSKTAFAELKNPTSQRLAQAITHDPGACQKDLCATVGVSAPVAHKYLRRLGEAGLLETRREWKTVRYFPTPRLEDLLGAVVASVPVRAEPAPEALVAAA